MFSSNSFGKNWSFNAATVRSNLISGFIIFLIALPLSIGISMASSAPPTAGILAAIVGGIFGSLISGSYVTISGPAAGLIVVILESVNSLGQGDVVKGFKVTLYAIIISGILQILMGLFRMGTLGLAVPINALHGLLASIGVIIITKQIFLLGGLKAKSETTFGQMFEFFQRIGELNLEILLIGLAGLALIITFNKVKSVAKVFPPALAAIVFGYVMSYVLDLEHEHVVDVFGTHPTVGPKFLLNVPVNFSEYFSSPSFEVSDWFLFIKAVFTIAFVASIESVLSTYAVDKLDPLKRNSNLNMDLISKGVCNTILGFIGGLPVISEIVRSTANVGNGGTERWSNLFHGLFILLFVLLAPQVLNHIPLTAFAAVLIFVGARLANPGQLVAIYRDGKEQLLVFTVTLIVTLSTDLLIGIFAGILTEFIVNIFMSGSITSNLKLKFTQNTKGESDKITVTSPVVFINMLKIKNLIESSKQSKVVLDLSQSPFVDYTSKVFIANTAKSLVGKTIDCLGVDLTSNEHH